MDDSDDEDYTYMEQPNKKPSYYDIDEVQAWDSVSEYSEDCDDREENSRDADEAELYNDAVLRYYGGDLGPNGEDLPPSLEAVDCAPVLDGEDNGTSLPPTDNVHDMAYDPTKSSFPYEELLSRQYNSAMTIETTSRAPPTASATGPTPAYDSMVIDNLSDCILPAPSHSSSLGSTLKSGDPAASDRKLKLKPKFLDSENGDLDLKYTVEDDLYDEEADDEDLAYYTKKKKETAGFKSRSDAVLSCACCFSLVCYNSQRHDVYSHQYRAMEVENCLVLTEERLIARPAPRKKKGKKEEVASAPVQGESDVYHPVLCSTCEAEIGLQDSEAIYHFFNVIPGAP